MTLLLQISLNFNEFIHIQRQFKPIALTAGIQEYGDISPYFHNESNVKP
jgi:hypothetical protein